MRSEHVRGNRMVWSSNIFSLNPIYSIVPSGAAILGVPAVILMPVSGVLLCDSPTLPLSGRQVAWGGVAEC